MHWILQNNLFNEKGYQTLLDTLERFSLPYTIHKVVPFVGELLPEPMLDTKNVICMGSYSLRHSAKRYGWNPGVFDLESFDFTIQKEKWGNHMLNFGAVVCRFDEVVFTEDEMFIRPIHDSKAFPGVVETADEFYAWQRDVKALNLNPDFINPLTDDTLVMVCPPKNIYSEHRFWVVKGQVVTSSTYKTGQRVHYQPIIDERFQWYAEERIAEWQPHDAFVIDIAETGAGLKVVEINTLNSCGFYSADIQSLVMALENNFDTEANR